ncbi:MAG: lytic transglycosylase domain-containing protein [Azospirillaceae bacterium]
MHAPPIRLGAVLWSLLLLVAGLWLLHALTVQGLPGEIRIDVTWPGLEGEEPAAEAVVGGDGEPAPLDPAAAASAGTAIAGGGTPATGDTPGDTPGDMPGDTPDATQAVLAATPVALQPGAWREDDALAGRARMIAAAAETFDLPPDWIAAVLWAAAQPDLDPPDGVGVMAVPEETYRTLAQAFDLALPADAPDEADAIFVGAAYLRMLYEMFGEPGFLAGYHLGAVPYGRLLFAQAEPPAATQAFVQALLPRLAGTRPADADAPRPPDLERFMRLVTPR